MTREQVRNIISGITDEQLSDMYADIRLKFRYMSHRFIRHKIQYNNRTIHQ